MKDDMAIRPRELSLFSGAGGGVLATKWLLGFKAVCYIEREPYCVEILKARIRDGLLDDAPIWDEASTFDGRPWRGCVDIVTAGFPCQPFSVAGKRQAELDERNGWPDAIRIIREVQPRWCFWKTSQDCFTFTDQISTELYEMDEFGSLSELSSSSLPTLGEFLQTWPRAGLMSGGKCYRLEKWERRTGDIGCGLWPTATQADANGHAQVAWSKTPGQTGGTTLAGAVLWGTPCSHPRTFTPRQVDHGVQLANQVAMFPTPLKRDARTFKGNVPPPGHQGSDNLGQHIGGTLNPDWTEWLMNWPVGWTSLEPLTGPIVLGPETWDTEPDIPRVATGVENRVGRLRAIGNGQVPLCAAVAWRLLATAQDCLDSEENQ